MRSAFLLIESVRLIYLMISVNSAPALNLTDLRAGISIGCLVFGLTPLRADFSATEKEPKPKRATLPPSFNSLDTVSTKASTASLHQLCLNRIFRYSIDKFCFVHDGLIINILNNFCDSLKSRCQM